jgi:hypothetical protein
MLRLPATDTRTIGAKNYSSIPRSSPGTVLSAFITNAAACNNTFPGSNLIELPDGGNPKASSSGNGPGDPLWLTGFDSVFDLLDFYADQGFTITLGTNIKFSVTLLVSFPLLEKPIPILQKITINA